MQHFEAKEHTPGRLHTLFADPYRAFDNDTDERQLHIRVMLHILFAQPLQQSPMTLRVIHGWENGSFEPSELKHIDYPLTSLEDLHRVTNEFSQASQQRQPLPAEDTSLLTAPLAKLFAQAEGRIITEATRNIPARWPALPGGLAIYTLFKMYHRLVYGEDDNYRCSQCETPEGLQELHEFHIEEGEFALLTPPAHYKKIVPTMLILHAGQLGPIEQLIRESLPLFPDR
ncbi:hypothetical protein K1Y77_12260 [Halomonas qaidamensis]|uniref:Uncharacterized protein n=1 Tax=Halomonas qaidamensis TaxID=2866211 RepID=A0ABY6JLW8_9GAMM|nr:hypothetical protein [Halomonas qaidamensis]UYV18253.1 hypothetical protein K1Y77_12260 [Halomonas qaidamensis]